MTYTPVEIPKFGGLNLQDDPQQIAAGAATDVLNVDLSMPGTIASRYGYANFVTSAADRYRTVFRYVASNGTVYLCASRPTGVDMIGTTGVVTWTQATNSTGWAGHAFARYGTPTVERVYFYTRGDSLRYFNGTLGTFGTAGGSPPNGYLLAVQQPDNRLVIGQLTTGPSRVQFSAAGDPDTWGANDYVELAPGDGEVLSAMVSWREMLFAFKQSRFWVFTGNATTSTGGAIFTNRVVDAGLGASNGYAVCAADDGVYFLNARGIFVTTGGPPVKISQALEPFFTGTPGPAWQGGTPTGYSDAVLSFANGRLYAAVTTTAGRRVFVLFNGQWSVWDLPAWQFATIPISGIETPFFSYSSGANNIGKFTSASTTDAGTAISWRYRTGFLNPGQPAAESVVREFAIDGTGTVNVKTAYNDGSLGSSASVALGTSPAIAQGRDRRAVRGRNVSLELSGTSAASVSRVIANVRGQRNAGLKAT